MSRLGGLQLAARHNPLDYTATARKAFHDRFLEDVDPRRELSESERVRRAAAARRAWYVRLALLSVQARQRTKKRAGDTYPALSEEKDVAAPSPTG